ncbi:MAG: SUF system NifU family Fe-S cluster assembly protein [Verrucomicrobia bacterium]|nr:MAG: SUF system NifU family Fe-S cluster assembly protein [Verrucomicrobiota bacterium]
MDTELYQEVILQNSKRPKNFGPLEGATHSAEGRNASCGDELQVQLIVNNDIIQQIKFTSSACAICTASASLMTGAVKGLPSSQALQICSKFRKMVVEGAPPEALSETLKVLAGVHQFPPRVKCATLPWETLSTALHSPPS